MIESRRDATSRADQAPALAFHRATVVGAGTMGRGIAYALARAGMHVDLVDPAPAQLAASLTDMHRWDQRAATRHADQIRTATELSGINCADIVVEAIPEILELKQCLFATLASLAPRHAILATNTSTLDIDAIAADSGRASHVIGLHFMLPAHVTTLIEIIPGQLTDPTITAAAKNLAQALGKVAVVAGNCDGFVGNRLFDSWHQEAMYLLEEGGSPEQIDTALEQWGMAIGPFRTLDLIDNRLPWGARRRRAHANPNLPQPLVGDRLCEAGFFGRAAGAGWYLHNAHTGERRPNPAVIEIAKQCAVEKFIEPDALLDQDIISRCLIALIREALDIYTEGHCHEPADIDLTFCLGYGFPQPKGGPLWLATSLNPVEVEMLSLRCQRMAGRGRSRLISVSELNNLRLAMDKHLSGALAC